MRASPHRRISDDFIAEIDKDETHCTVDEIVSQLKQQIHGDEKLNFLMVCKPASDVSIDGECRPEEPDSRKFCVGIVFADAAQLTGLGRAVHVSDLGNRFAVSFMEAVRQHSTGKARTLMQRLFA